MKFCSLALLLSFIATISFGQKEITVEDIWQNYTFYPKSVPGFNFLNDGKHYTRLEGNTIKKYDITSGNFVEDLLAGDALASKGVFEGKIGSYTFSKDESKILIKSQSESIYRRSSKAFFHIYDFSSETLTAIFDEDKIMYATFSPDASKVAYVWQNNIYWFDVATGITEPVTMDGEKNKIINGSADWVYEEEFAFAKAFWWSPDGSKLAYIRFDETEVPEFTMTLFNDDLYPEYETWKYPKVGEKNAKVSAHIFNVDNSNTNIAEVGDLEDMYIPRVKWTKDPNKLCVFKMNRHQNHLQLYLVEANSGKSSILLDEKNKYYIDITDNLTFLEDGKQFVWTSEKSGYNHIYLYDLKGNEKTQLTKGSYDVTSFYGVDEKNKKVFYQAAEDSPLGRQVYVVGLNGKKKKKLTQNAGTHSAQFSSTYDYFTGTFSTINSAASYTVYNRDGKVVRSLEENIRMGS